MAGHSKWKQIKHKKALLDTKRGKAFTKLIKEITIAARMGGGDPTGNPRLRFLLDKAKAINMPQENSSRAIKKGTGELPGVSYEAATYEGYGPNNVAVIVDVLTDNKNKAIADLRHTFSRQGGRIADAGSVSWMFEKLGVIEVPAGNLTEDALLELFLEHNVDGIRDVAIADDVAMITCEPKALEEVKTALQAAQIKVSEAELEWVAKNELALNENAEEKTLEFLQAIEDLEDVQNVYTNMA